MTCPFCGGAVEPRKGPGRPRQYCSDDHYRRHYAQRARDEVAALRAVVRQLVAFGARVELLDKPGQAVVNRALYARRRVPEVS